MVGVAGPLLSYDRKAYLKFCVSLTVGLGVSGVLVSLMILVAGRAMHAIVPGTVRVAGFGLVIAALAVADLFGATPYLHRQTPKTLRDRLGLERIGQVGLLWGLDIGLLVSTKKTGALLWGICSYCLLVDPSAAMTLVPASLLSYAAATVVASATRAFDEACDLESASRYGRTLRLSGLVSGVILAGGGVALIGNVHPHG